jgi:T6SS, Phospholipase effector Tle1-like, catalytic domain
VQQVWFPGVHCDVGGSYAEAELSNITLRWMIDNAEAQGLVFDQTAVDSCLGPKPFNPKGIAHGEWKIIPWGIPKHRTVPTNAVLSNTVKIRMDQDPTYRPENLQNRSVDGYAIATVIPASDL